MKELLESDTPLHVLLRPGASEHTYEPSPSDAILAENAVALVQVSDDLDAWATGLTTALRISLFDLIPDSEKLPMEEHHDPEDSHHHHGEFDPHFWLDPTLLTQCIDPLTQKLQAAGIETDAGKTAKFKDGLIQIDIELQRILAPLKGKKVILHHPSMRYFMQRYGIIVAGYIEASPGKEASPQEVARLLELIKSEGVDIICSEPQLSKRAAQTLAEGAGIALVEVDPIGGREGLETYSQLMLNNARQLAGAL